MTGISHCVLRSRFGGTTSFFLHELEALCDLVGLAVSALTASVEVAPCPAPSIGTARALIVD